MRSENAYLSNYKRLVDFMADHQLNALIVWGFLRDTHGGESAALKLCEYAEARGVRIVPGVGVNSYGGFWYTGDQEFSLDGWLKQHPELRAIGKDGEPVYWSWPEGIDPSVHTNACPSKEETREWYLRGIEWLFEEFPVGGVCLETGDAGTLCHCKDCVREVPDRGKEKGNVSFPDMKRALPGLIERAHSIAPDALIVYATYSLWDSPLLNLAPGFGKSIPDYALAMWTYRHDPTDILRDNLDELRVFKDRLRPPVKHNLIFACYGGCAPAFGLHGRPQYRQISRLCKRISEMGLDGLTIYGEVSDSFSAKGCNDINYLALQDFSENPRMKVEDFEDKHKSALEASGMELLKN